MSFMCRILIAVAILLIVPFTNSSAEDYYGVESIFQIGTGGRPAGMGGAFAAVCDDGSAVYYNPAGLAFLEYRELTLFSANLYENTDFMFGSFSYPILGFGTIGVGGMRLGTDGVVFRDQLGKLGEHDYADGQYWLSYGLKIFDNISVGANFKYLNKTLGDLSTSTGSFDLGFLANYRKFIFVGINLQDILGGELKLGSSGEKVPFNFKGGISVRHRFEKIGLILAMDGDKTKDAKTRFHFGGEICYNDIACLRGGYDRTEITLGAGLRYKMISFDYAYRAHSELGGVHRWGISFHFGPSITEQNARRIHKQRQGERMRMEEARSMQISRLLSKAEVFYNTEVWDSASFYYNQVLAFDPENMDVITRLKEMAAKAESDAQVQVDTKALQIASEQLLQKYSKNADSLFAIEEYENASMEYSKVLQLDPEDRQAQNRLREINDVFQAKFDGFMREGRAYIEQEKYAEAVVAFNEALKLRPGNRSVMDRINFAKTRLLVAQKLRRAMELLNEEDTAAAEIVFNEILGIDPEEKVALDYLQSIRQKEQIRPVSIDELKGDAEIWRLYLDGLQYFSQGEYEKAIESWEAVLARYPGSEDTKENIRHAKSRLERKKQ